MGEQITPASSRLVTETHGFLASGGNLSFDGLRDDLPDVPPHPDLLALLNSGCLSMPVDAVRCGLLFNSMHGLILGGQFVFGLYDYPCGAGNNR